MRTLQCGDLQGSPSRFSFPENGTDPGSSDELCAGGLGFLEQAPWAFSPMVLALSAVIASHQAHQILHHQADVNALTLPLGMFVTALLVLCPGPFLLFSAPLRQLKRRSLLAYGAPVGQHGWLVQKRWILGEPVADKGRLEAPELGPVADTITMCEVVRRINAAPLGKQSLRAVVSPALLPMIPVLAITVPVNATRLKWLGVLM